MQKMLTDFDSEHFNQSQTVQRMELSEMFKIKFHVTFISSTCDHMYDFSAV